MKGNGMAPPDPVKLLKAVNELLDDGYDGKHAKRFRHIRNWKPDDFRVEGLSRLRSQVEEAKNGK
jgi:hypothetical protein